MIVEFIPIDENGKLDLLPTSCENLTIQVIMYPAEFFVLSNYVNSNPDIYNIIWVRDLLKSFKTVGNNVLNIPQECIVLTYNKNLSPASMELYEKHGNYISLMKDSTKQIMETWEDEDYECINANYQSAGVLVTETGRLLGQILLDEITAKTSVFLAELNIGELIYEDNVE